MPVQIIYGVRTSERSGNSGMVGSEGPHGYLRRNVASLPHTPVNVWARRCTNSPSSF